MEAITPYERCATRLEGRGEHPPTPQYVADLVGGLRRSGVGAIWHSAVDSRGQPLFPSRVFPDHHPQASLEAFRNLLDPVHKLGLSVLSWYPMNLGSGVLRSHPDWRMQFYEMENTASNEEWAARHVCFNSPYGELLPRFAAEVVRDVGYDGIWFDGSTFSNHNTGSWFAPGCRCGFCRRRFRRDAGLDLPARVDCADSTFKRWVQWRYDVLMQVWKACVDAVTAVRSDAVVCFNNYRRRGRRPFGWNTAIPLRRLGWDCLMSGEFDGFPHQADFQMKINRAYGCTRGVESWWPLNDGVVAWVPDHDPLPAIQAHLGAISAGGAASMGVGVSVKVFAPVLAAIQHEAGPRIRFNDGQTVEYAALWCSQQHQDFACPGQPDEAWDQWHGMNEICRHAHLQTSVVFDDHVERGELDRYPVLLVGETRCISGAQAAQLRRYVERGGVLVACREVGTLNEWGGRHRRPILDELLGIKARRAGAGSPTLEIRAGALARACGRHVSYPGAFIVATPAKDARLLADVVERTAGGWDGAEGDGAPAPRSPGLWLRRVGRGWTVWAGVELFGSYLHTPTPRMRQLLALILTKLRRPAVALEGPLCVTINTRRRADGTLLIHLHNNPGTAYAYPTPPLANYLRTPGEVLEARDLAVHLHGMTAQSARSGLSGNRTKRSNRGRTIIVPRLALHDVLLLKVVKSGKTRRASRNAGIPSEP